MRSWLMLLLICLTPASLTLSSPAHADMTLPGVIRMSTPLDVDTAYQRLYQALEGERFWVVFETDMGSRMEKMRERWGADYNRQQLIGVRSMVFCNIDWTHRIANADPQLLALCPLHLSVYGQDGTTTVVMPRPSVLAAGSAGLDAANSLEAELTRIIQGALSQH